MNIYLTGFMGSGKSSAGRKAASLLGRPFADSDMLIEEKEKMTVTQIFAEKGEEYFREREAETLLELSHQSGIVVACGGATSCTTENLARMKASGVIIYLRYRPETLAGRLRHLKDHRPLLRAAGSRQLGPLVTKMLGERTVWYEQSDLIIDADGMTEDEVADLITQKTREKRI